MTLKAPSGRHHQRSHSWPPFHLHATPQKKSIDDDPFAFFISASDGPVIFPDDSTAAGIEPSPRARSLSPFLSRTHHEPNLAALTAASRIAKLKKWIIKMERRYLNYKPPSPSGVPQNSPASPLQRSPAPPLPRSPASPQIRGRGNTRGSPRSLASRGTRSHSARPRVWREPSGDIWTVLEEQEDVGLGISM